MAVTAAEVGTGVDTRIWDVTATADGDTGISIPHGFPSAPEYVVIQGLHAVARVALWTATTDGTNVILSKATTASSSTGTAQVRVVAKRRVTSDR